MARKSRLRIHGTDRGLMMLARDVRRRWLQYGENRKIPLILCSCGSTENIEADHVEPVGPRPRTPKEFGPYITKMFFNKCQALCRVCNKKKGERKNGGI